MTLKNLMRRFVHCRRHGDGGGCDYFQWVDEFLDDRVRSMLAGLMVNNERMAAKIQRLENESDIQKYELNKMKEKNGRLKLKLCICHRRQKLIYLLCDCVDFDCDNVHWPCVRAM